MFNVRDSPLHLIRYVVVVLFDGVTEVVKVPFVSLSAHGVKFVAVQVSVAFDILHERVTD